MNIETADLGPDIINRVKFTSKELQCGEFGGVSSLHNSLEWEDFGARMQDPQIGRWNGVDPEANKRNWVSPYNFVQNNPIRKFDIDGKLDGDFYSTSSQWLYSDGKNDNKAYVVNANGPFAEQTSADELPVSHSNLLLIASVSYGESSTKNDKFEMAAISNTMMNATNLMPGSDISTKLTGYTFAMTDGNERVAQFNKNTSQGRNGTAQQSALWGAINAVNGGYDYSHGATQFAGSDIGSSKEKRATGGLLFTDPKHDIYGVGSKVAPGAPVIGKNGDGSFRGIYNYTYESTAAYGGTVFMRKTNDFIKATGAPKY